MPKDCMEDTVSFLRFYYPDIPSKDWSYDNLNTADRFQNYPVNKDCGFHICYFMRAAVTNKRIPRMHEEFNTFKKKWNPIFLIFNPPKKQSDTTESQLTVSTTTTSMLTIPISTQSQPVQPQPVEETTANVTNNETEVESPTQINPITNG